MKNVPLECSLTFSVASGAPWVHYYAKNSVDSFTKEIKAVFKEWTALRASLPLNLASSIFVRVDENQVSRPQKCAKYIFLEVCSTNRHARTGVKLF